MPALENKMSDEIIDKHLDAVLRASGSGLRYFSSVKTIDDMRQAMRLAIAAAVAELAERLAKV